MIEEPPDNKYLKKNSFILPTGCQSRRGLHTRQGPPCIMCFPGRRAVVLLPCAFGAILGCLSALGEAEGGLQDSVGRWPTQLKPEQVVYLLHSDTDTSAATLLLCVSDNLFGGRPGC